jgi:diadenylate cyclase
VIKAKQPSSIEAFRQALVMVAPGTPLRDAVSAIIQGGTGALLCIGDEKRLSDLSEGGVKLDAAVTPQLIFELTKMDGAIILNEDCTRILYANRFLKPASKIPSDETGTRHRVAQRLAEQAKCTVIAVSQRRSTVTLYVHDQRHIMDTIGTLMNKASQAMQTLEKYMAVLRLAMQELTEREFQDVVTIFDVCRAVQRTEMCERIAQEIEPYLIELGTEGRLIELQMKEIMLPLREALLVVKDYYRERPGVTYESVRARISEIEQPELLQLGSISQALGYGPNLRSIDNYLTPRGYRVLTITRRLPAQIIENLVAHFGSLQKIIRAPKDELQAADGVGETLAERIRVSLNLMRNPLSLDDRR